MSNFLESIFLSISGIPLWEAVSQEDIQGTKFPRTKLEYYPRDGVVQERKFSKFY